MFVAHAHDLAVFAPRRDLQLIGTAAALNGQGMVTVHRQGLGQSVKHPQAHMLDNRGLAVHQLLGANNSTPKGRANALVTQADPENRDLARKVLDGRHRNPRFIGRTRTWRDHEPIGCQGLDFLQGDLIVAHHRHARSELCQVLHHIEGEGVVIVNHEQVQSQEAARGVLVQLIRGQDSPG